MLDLDEAIRLDPRQSEAYLMRGRVHLMLKKKTLAKRDLEKAVSLGVPQSEVRELMNQCKLESRVSDKISDELYKLFPIFLFLIVADAAYVAESVERGWSLNGQQMQNFVGQDEVSRQYLFVSQSFA